MILWREDYPFTKWGMYYRLHDFRPFIKISVKVNDQENRPEHRFIKEPWMLREKLWELLGLGGSSLDLKKSIYEYEQIAKKNAQENEDKIREILIQSLHDSKNIDNVEISFLAWERLNAQAIHNPDISATLFAGRGL